MKAVSELVIIGQAVYRFGLRALAEGLGRNRDQWANSRGKKRRGKGQARYQPTEKTESIKQRAHSAQSQVGESSVSTVNPPLEAPAVMPIGTLTEIRSIADLNGQARDTQQDLQQGLSQILPAVAGMCRQRWLVLVAPPCLPAKAELSAAGIDPARVLIVHPGALHAPDVLEQTLRSGTCGAVLAWLEKGDAQSLDRLSRAAEAGHTWGVLFRASNRNKKPAESARFPAANTAEKSQLQMAMV